MTASFLGVMSLTPSGIANIFSEPTEVYEYGSEYRFNAADAKPLTIAHKP